MICDWLIKLNASHLRLLHPSGYSHLASCSMHFTKTTKCHKIQPQSIPIVSTMLLKPIRIGSGSKCMSVSCHLCSWATLFSTTCKSLYIKAVIQTVFNAVAKSVAFGLIAQKCICLMYLSHDALVLWHVLEYDKRKCDGFMYL